MGGGQCRGTHVSGLNGNPSQTENFHSEISGGFLGFEFSLDGSEKAWFFRRQAELDFKILN
jgi:hypothetical protein